MAWGAIAGAVIGGMMSSNASGDAASLQAGAADRASGVNKYIFDKQVELQQPFREAGVGALNRLSYLMGISPTGYSSLSGINEAELRKQLEPQFRRQVGDNTMFTYGLNESPEKWGPVYETDQAALNAEVQRRIAAQQSAADQAATTAAGADPNFGSLMKKFGLEDFQADPGYQFRQTEGMKGIENSAAARGNLLSGGALKAIQKYGQDLASQEYGNAYSRFNADQTNQYNKLAGLVNTGQGASNQLTNAAANYGSNVSNNIIGAGNAQAAGVVGQANAWNNAIGQGTNLYQQNQLMDLIRNPALYYSQNGRFGYSTSPGE